MDKSILKKMAEVSAHNMMLLILLLTIITLSIGLAFFFLVLGPVGYGVGVTMFIVASLIFVIGEIFYLKKINNIREIAE